MDRGKTVSEEVSGELGHFGEWSVNGAGTRLKAVLQEGQLTVPFRCHSRPLRVGRGEGCPGSWARGTYSF